MVEQHVLHTNSLKGRHILDNWETFKNRFTKVVPVAYEEMQAAIAKYVAEGLSQHDAEEKAFADKYAK